jgi:prepilin-type N-terminal cleavage/methylation domain-containing protein
MSTNRKFPYLIKNRGFTLIETFVAITILLIAVVGPLSAIAKFYADNNFAKNQIAAAFLAQDGLETAVNMINNGRIKFSEDHQEDCLGYVEAHPDDNRWLGLGDYCQSAAGCDIDSLTQNVTENCPEAGCRLYKRPATENDAGYYTTAGAEGAISTPYTRRIKLTLAPVRASSPEDAILSMRSITVTSELRWSGRGAPVKPIKVSTTVIENICR